MEDLQAGFSNYFDDVPDPRVERTKHHLLKDILVIALLAVIAGANGWKDMENYGISKLTWLQKFLNGTYPAPFESCISNPHQWGAQT